MAEKKITKREQFEKVIAILTEQEQTELVTFIQHEIELLDKKKSSKKKSDNTELLDEVYGYLVSMDKPCKVSEIITRYNLLPPMSSAKITSLLTELVKQGRATKELVKGTNSYKAVVEETEETEEA